MAEEPRVFVLLEDIVYSRLADDVGPDLHVTAWVDAQPPVIIERKQRYGEDSSARRLLAALPIDAESFTLHIELEETDTRPELDDRGQAEVRVAVPAALRREGGPRAVDGGVVYGEIWAVGGDAGEIAVVGLRLRLLRASDGAAALFLLDEGGAVLPDGATLSPGQAFTAVCVSPSGAPVEVVTLSGGSLSSGDGEAGQGGLWRQRRYTVDFLEGEGEARLQAGGDADTLHLSGPVGRRFVLSGFGTLWNPRRPVAERQAAFQVGVQLAEAAQRGLEIVGDEGLKLRRGEDMEGQTRYLLHASVDAARLGPLEGAEVGDVVMIGGAQMFVVDAG